jgi:predicted P-loop ATPase
LDALRAQRDQIFAEARDRYRNGAKWYVMPDSTDEEQSERAAPDLWTDRVIDYCTDLAGQRIAVTSSRILSDAIELPLAKQTDAEKRRIARIMRENGWVQRRDQYGRKWKKVER